jgi:phosphoglycerate dehydrogenase-like enzyme
MGKNFGVIGLGYNGRRIAEIAKCFGADVSYWDITRNTTYEKKGISFLAVDEILRTADIITINIIKNQQTVNFISEERIQIIKKNAVLINSSPMELVDFDTILKRVETCDITFIFDHSDEMSPEQVRAMEPFMKLGSNLIAYPPIAYTTKESVVRKKRNVCFQYGKLSEWATCKQSKLILCFFGKEITKCLNS